MPRRNLAPPPDLPADQMVGKGEAYLPWLAACLMLAVVSPVMLNIGDFLLTPTRLICVLSIPILGLRLFLMRAYGRVTIIDWLMVFYALWIMLAYLTNNGMSQFVFASLTASNTLGGYLIGRAAIRSVGHLQAVAKWMVAIIIILFPFALYEGINGPYVIPPLIDSIPGLSSLREVDYGRRLGISRAQAVFAHPIHFGLYCSLPVSLYFVGLTNQISLGTRIFVTVFILGSCFMAVSSGPFFTALFQLALIGYMMITRSFLHQWRILIWSAALVYAVIELASNRFGLYAIASRLAFDPWTAFYRRLIWEYGTAQVARTPVFGVGANDWARPHWMTSSIDNFWLQMAVNYGQPASYAMLAVFLIMMFRIGRGYVRGTDAYNMRVGWTFLFVGLLLSLSTVTIWNEILTMIMFLVGAGVFMLQAEPPEAAEKTPPGRAGGRRAGGAGARRGGTAPGPETDSAGGAAAEAPAPRIAYTRFPGGRKG